MNEREKFLEDHPYIPRRFVVLDIETTGLDAESCEIIEIAAVLFDLSEINHTTYNCLIKPINPVPKRITQLTGITQYMVDSEGHDLIEEISFLREFIEDLPIVAYNAKFDLGFLKKAFEQINFKPKNKVICALKMARKAWDLPSYKLTYVAEAFGWDTSGSHRALKDCELAGLVYVSAARKIGKAS